MRPIDADALEQKIGTMGLPEIDILNHKINLEAVYSAIRCAPTIGCWISVEDKLPARKWVDYLVATRIQTDGSRGFNIAWLKENDVWTSNDKWICDGREIVTHWMPLPELPKEESDG